MSPQMQYLSQLNQTANLDADFSESPMMSHTVVDLGPQKMLLNREKQFVDYAPVFRNQDGFDKLSTVPTAAKQYSATLPTKAGRATGRSTRDGRWDRWEPKTLNRQYTDLNDRDETFDINSAFKESPAGVASGLVNFAPYQPQSYQTIKTTASQQSKDQPRSSLISSAKLQIGAQPQNSLHSSANPFAGNVNPLVGYSEGELQKQLYKKQFMNFALSQAEGSIQDVRERSRSKSRRAKYEAARRKALEEAQEASFVDLINASKAQEYSNRLALKQRHAYSPAGSIARANSAQLVRASSAADSQGDMQLNYQSSVSTAPTRASLPVNSRPNLGQPPQQQYNPTKVLEQANQFGVQPDVLIREQQKADYRALLQEQINEKNEKKRVARLKEAEDEARLMSDYANFYRIGALKQGGGSPIRGPNGEVIAQHAPFSSQSQHNGGVEFQERNGANQRQYQSSYTQDFGAANAETTHRGETLSKTMAGTYSPKRNEIMHMKPSNMFEDITEEEFNRREQDKKAYQNELFQQMNEAKEKKRIEQERIRRQELEDERKIFAQLDQMREAYRKEENPKDNASQLRSVSQISNHERPGSQVKAPPSSHHIVSMSMASVDYHAQYPSYGAPAPDPYSEGRNGSPPRQSSFNDYSVQDQLQKLNRVQEEIITKNKIDRLETDQIFKDLLDSNRKLSRSGKQQDSPYALHNTPSHISITNMAGKPGSSFDQDMSGNLRLESHFTKIHSRQQPTSKLLSEKSPTTQIDTFSSVNRLSEGVSLGGKASYVAASIENKSAIHRLEDLIDDFSRPDERFDER